MLRGRIKDGRNKKLCLSKYKYKITNVMNSKPLTCLLAAAHISWYTYSRNLKRVIKKLYNSVIYSSNFKNTLHFKWYASTHYIHPKPKPILINSRWMIRQFCFTYIHMQIYTHCTHAKLKSLLASLE